MLTVVCWKWKPYDPHYRSKFSAENVNIFRNMVERHYKGDFEVVCITDDPTGIDERVRVVPLWDDFRAIPSPLGVGYPACYTRLLAFRSEFRDLVGDRFVSVDLDCVITGDVTEIWNRPEDFVIWENNAYKNWLPGQRLEEGVQVTPYNGSMWMMTTGARSQVYDEFDPGRSPILTYYANLVGSDQAWFAYTLGDKEAVWTMEDGVYAWRHHMKNRNYRLPPSARIIFFQGQEDPWDESALKKAPWIKEHYK